MGGRRAFLLAVGALAMLAGTGCSDDDGATGPTSSTAASTTAVSTTMPSTTGPSTTGPSTTGPSTTGPSTTASVITTTPVTTTTLAPTAAGVVGPPGRLPFLDVTTKIAALLPSQVVVNDALALATETTKRLSASFAATGFAADVRGVSLVDVVRAGRPAGSVMASVIEVRNREESGDDTSPGYDLVVTMERNGTGNWTIDKAEEQRICSRGATTSGGAPVCV
jgi:hypothetical protein